MSTRSSISYSDTHHLFDDCNTRDENGHWGIFLLVKADQLGGSGDGPDGDETEIRIPRDVMDQIATAWIKRTGRPDFGDPKREVLVPLDRWAAAQAVYVAAKEFLRDGEAARPALERAVKE